MSLENYFVEYGTYGPWRRGNVIPRWWLDGNRHNIEALVAQGVIRPTPAPVNVDVVPPVAKTTVDPAPALQQEINRLRAENEELAKGNKVLDAQATELARQREARDRSLGEQTAEIDRLRSLLADREAEIERLLEAATQPSGA